jgi:hypothetical protein
MKKCSLSLAIKEMHVKIILRFHLTPVRIAISHRTPSTTNVGEDAGKKEPSNTVGGNVSSTTTKENSMEVPQKTKHRSAI